MNTLNRERVKLMILIFEMWLIILFGKSNDERTNDTELIIVDKK